MRGRRLSRLGRGRHRERRVGAYIASSNVVAVGCWRPTANTRRRAPAGERGRDVVADHRPLRGQRDLAQRHRPGELGRRRPSALRRRARRCSRPPAGTRRRRRRSDRSSRSAPDARPLPMVAGSTARPGMKWSTRAGHRVDRDPRRRRDQFTPSVDVTEHDVVGGAVLSGSGSPPRRRRPCLRHRSRRSAAGWCADPRRPRGTGRSTPRRPCVHEAPPSVEVNASILPLRLSNGTITVPFGWTTGCPPRPLSFPAVEIGTLQVRPPSVEVLISSRSPCAEVVELGVAVTVERAGRAVVADRPVLVQVDLASPPAAGSTPDAPCPAVVGRSVHEHRRHREARAGAGSRRSATRHGRRRRRRDGSLTRSNGLPRRPG